MKAFHDEVHDIYDILNMSLDDIIALSEVLNSCDLTHRRIFFSLKEEIDKFISIKKLPKKKVIWKTCQ